MFLTREQSRMLDRRAIEEFGIPGVVLMENAGRNMAELLRSLGIHGPVAVCCGKGNNGGDGFVIARHLDNLGVPVRVLLFGRPEALTGEAAVMFGILARSGFPVVVQGDGLPDLSKLRRELGAVEWIVDALFGTGLSGPVRPPFDEVIQAINASEAHVFAVDIPSGLDCDTGQPLGATVRAYHTATTVAPKPGFAQPEARSWVGLVHVVDIGLPFRALFPAES